MAKKNDDMTRMKLALIALIVMFVGIIWIISNENERNNLMTIIGIGIIGLGIAYGIRILLKYKPWKKNRKKKNPFDFDTEINIPDKEPITGSFVCASCGATTTIKNEINPLPRCRFCHAVISDLQDVIDMRDNRYRTACNQEIEYKMRLRELQQTRNNRLEELEKQKELERQRMEFEKEQERIRFEREEQERENEHRREMQRTDAALGGGIAFLVILFILFRLLVSR